MKKSGSFFSLPVQMMLGLILGSIAGIFLTPQFTTEYVKPFGDLFITLIRMVVIPLVFCTIVAGTASIADLSKLGRVAAKTLIYYFATTGVAITIGLIFAIIVQPGAGMDMAIGSQTAPTVNAPPLLKVLMNIVPMNPMDAMNKGNMLQVIFFAVLLGISVSAIGDPGKPALQFFDSVAAAMIKMTNIVMLYAPIGVFALMSFTVSKHGLSVLIPLAKFIIIMYAAAVVHAFVTYYPCVRFGAGLNFGTFIKTLSEPLLIAFTTTSSAAALAVNMMCVRKMGASKSISSFSIPLGNTINMDGTAIYMGIAAVFAAGAYGIDLGMGDYLTIVLMGLLASIGTAGVPGAALIMISIVFVQINVPLEAIALIAGIDRILDMARTTLNVLGDATGAVLVTKLEGDLGKDLLSEEEMKA